MDNRNSDIVFLNVGGTLFTSSVSTLVSSSIYFESCLSKEWRNQDISGEEPIFIDQDPKLFSVLLSYMRLGYIEASELTKPVLILANFLGMQQLLKAVKTEARRSKFEERNSEIFSTAQAALLVKENDVRKEFASLSMYNPDHMKFVNNRDVSPDFVVSVEIQGEDGMVQIIPDCVTFIDALDYLSKLGYAKYEKDKLETTTAYERVNARLWFSKLIAYDAEDMEVDSKEQYFTLDTTIIGEDTRDKHQSYPRQFCCMIESTGSRNPYENEDHTSLEAQVGTKEELCPIVKDGEEWESRKVRSFALRDLDSNIKKYNWLQKQGYVYSENEIVQAYYKAIECLFRQKEVLGPGKISIWSRPLNESDYA
mmetsp:Transcript_984/g.2261  ORF Transcript_984/g.2261 Transcript_984/m.2261 type:complete len:367 (-) Transcript_984:181-1281(-)